MSIKLSTLKRLYAQAVKDKAESFILEDNGAKHTLLTSYAKYLIQHLQNKNVESVSLTSSA